MTGLRDPVRQNGWSISGLFVSMLLILNGCQGYQQSGSGTGQGYQWSSLYRQDIRTIAVPIFTNVDFSRGDEFALTKALIMQIEQRTPYKVVDREQADTILEGQITRVRKQTLSNNRQSGLPQEQLYTIRVDFTWKDLRTGKILVERRGFEQNATYYPTLGEGRSQAQLNTAEQLAVAIVQELEADW
ncbi:MAG: hypothetical protein KatS3mg104_0828 [Phycisphaerae bacterium]|nr:MAG: hypothetical protein KatS3mg104_0828 [Phycisphaerae bacterium]